MEDIASNSHAADEAPDAKRPATARAKNPSINAKSSTAAKAQSNSVTAEVLIKGLPDGDGSTPAEKTEIVITDAEGAKRSENVSCLFCGKDIE